MFVLKIALMFAVVLITFLLAGTVIAAEEGGLLGLVIGGCLSFGLYYFCDQMVVKMCGAEKLTVYHAPTLFRTVRDLSDETGVKVEDIYMIPEQASNALAVGKREGAGSLVFTEGLLKSLSQEELRHVISHLLVQIKNSDAQMGCIVAAISSLFGLGSKAAQHKATMETHGISLVKKTKELAFRGVVVAMSPIAVFIVRRMIKAKRIFVADEQAVKIAGSNFEMASAVRTLEKKKHVSPMRIVPAVAHLFVVSPLTAGRFAQSLMTHPPMDQRIARLEEMHRQTVPVRVALPATR